MSRKKNFFANFGSLDLRCDYDLAVKNDQGGDVGFLRVMSLTLVECYPPLRWGGQVGPLSLTLCSAPKSLFSRSSHNPDGDCHNPRNQTISPSQSDLVTTLKSSQRQLQQVLCPCLRLELLLLPWMASSCRAGARSLKVSEAAATAARQPGGGRREGETYVTTKQNKTLPKPYSATKFYHSFFSPAVEEPRLLQEADLEVGSRLLPDDPEVA